MSSDVFNFLVREARTTHQTSKSVRVATALGLPHVLQSEEVSSDEGIKVTANNYQYNTISIICDVSHLWCIAASDPLMLKETVS